MGVAVVPVSSHKQVGLEGARCGACWLRFSLPPGARAAFLVARCERCSRRSVEQAETGEICGAFRPCPPPSCFFIPDLISLFGVAISPKGSSTSMFSKRCSSSARCCFVCSQKDFLPQFGELCALGLLPT
ncbi:unnamed protein product [Scytosiphon promiscuus]